MFSEKNASTVTAPAPALLVRKTARTHGSKSAKHGTTDFGGAININMNKFRLGSGQPVQVDPRKPQSVTRQHVKNSITIDSRQGLVRRLLPIGKALPD
ncbi:MAG: hypothetical protein IPK97_20820 [Ahniella sp.]|nr:hypothetical protein [Ahniella sp.]